MGQLVGHAHRYHRHGPGQLNRPVAAAAPAAAVNASLRLATLTNYPFYNIHSSYSFLFVNSDLAYTGSKE